MGAPSNAFLARTLKAAPDGSPVYERLVWSRPDEPDIWDSFYRGSNPVSPYLIIRLDDEGSSDAAFIEFDLLPDFKGDGVSLDSFEFKKYLFDYEGHGHYEMLMQPYSIKWRKDGGEWVELLDDYYWVSPEWHYEWISNNFIVDPGITSDDKNWMLGIRFDGDIGVHIDNINIYFIGDKPTAKSFWTDGVMCKYIQST